MTRMPGTAACARALLVVVGAAGVVALGWLAVFTATFRPGTPGRLETALVVLAAVPFALLAAASFVLAARFAGGGPGSASARSSWAGRSPSAARWSPWPSTGRGGLASPWAPC